MAINGRKKKVGKMVVSGFLGGGKKRMKSLARSFNNWPNY